MLIWPRFSTKVENYHPFWKLSWVIATWMTQPPPASLRLISSTWLMSHEPWVIRLHSGSWLADDGWLVGGKRIPVVLFVNDRSMDIWQTWPASCRMTQGLTHLPKNRLLKSSFFYYLFQRLSSLLKDWFKNWRTFIHMCHSIVSVVEINHIYF